MTPPSMGDHVRPADAEYPDGIYRVVGTSGETVTLLRVGDVDGRRVTTGETLRVDDEELAGFGSAENPDGNRLLGAVAASSLEMVYWRFRAFGQQLTAHPLPASVAATLVAVGYLGDASLPDAVASVALFVGVVGLAYVGGGYLSG